MKYLKVNRLLIFPTNSFSVDICTNYIGLDAIHIFQAINNVKDYSNDYKINLSSSPVFKTTSITVI